MISTLSNEGGGRTRLGDFGAGMQELLGIVYNLPSVSVTLWLEDLRMIFNRSLHMLI